MTETAIMKALACCNTNIMADCKICNLRLEDGSIRPYCTTILIGNALDLINRKNEENESLQIKKEHLVVFLAEAKAEVERLKAIEESHREQNGELRKEVERLKKMKTIGTTDWLTKGMSAEQLAEKKAKAIGECNAEIRAEAIKEFAERVKEICTVPNDRLWIPTNWLLTVFDQIAKEMGVEINV